MNNDGLNRNRIAVRVEARLLWGLEQPCTFLPTTATEDRRTQRRHADRKRRKEQAAQRRAKGDE